MNESLPETPVARAKGERGGKGEMGTQAKMDQSNPRVWNGKSGVLKMDPIGRVGGWALT